MDGWVWSNGGMILTGEDWSTGRKTLYSVGGRWMSEYGAMVEWYWQGKTEVLGEKHYTAWVVDGWVSMEQWWNDTDRGKLKYWEKKKFVYHLQHRDSSGIEPSPLRYIVTFGRCIVFAYSTQNQTVKVWWIKPPTLWMFMGIWFFQNLT